MDYEALKNEIEIDPEGMGYAELVKKGSDQGIADLLNSPNSGRVNKGVILAKDFFYDFGFIIMRIPFVPDAAARSAFEWAVNVADKAGRINLAAPEIDGDLTVDPPVIGFRQQAADAGLCTDEKWEDAATRPASRAEMLPGVGVEVTATDVSKALGHYGLHKMADPEEAK